MKKWLLLLTLALIAITAIFAFLKSQNIKNTQITRQQYKEKLYVAVEGEGKVAVIDPKDKKVIKNIDLSSKHEEGQMTFKPHNIQVAPDGKTVWVTANAGSHFENPSHSLRLVTDVYSDHAGEMGSPPDEIIAIDTQKDQITIRIPITIDAHLAHVVITSDNNFAYVAAQEGNAVYKVDIKSQNIDRKIELKEGSQPHGIRLSPDESFAYVALMEGKSLGIISLEDDSVTQVPLEGKAVQTGVTPDGAYALTSVYDTKKLALYEIDTKNLTYVDLPEEAKGPVQMYPTPDSKYVYVADQGYYFNQPAAETVYKIDLAQKKVIAKIKAGSAPHGVVISNDGKLLYVTNLLSEDVSVIDTSTDTEIARVKVGKEPNGITYWSN